MGASITLAGESLIAQKHIAQQTLTVARFILANVPGLDPNGPVDRAAGKPAAGQIVGTYAVTQAGFVNPNQVVYSLMLGSDIGDFDWNWIGLETTDNVLLAVSYVPTQQKRRNIPPLQLGNNVTRNFLVVFDGAQALTGLTIDASTWQHDFTVRLAGIDARERQSNRDIFGRACFFGSALQLEKVGAVYQLKPGTAYVEGVRLQRAAALPVVPPAFPTIAWLDVALQRELNDVVASWSVVWGSGKVDYVDSAGVQHYCVAIADLPDSNTITDSRPVENIDGPLVAHFAARVGDYAGLRARSTTKDDVGLGNLPNAKSDDPASNDSNVLATTKLVRAALDQLDDKASVEFTTIAAVNLSGLAVQAGGDWTVPLTAGARVLVKNQASGALNGLYVAAAGAWSRANDADTSEKVTPNLRVTVEKGSQHADSMWLLVTDGPVILGTTALTFEQIAGKTGVSAGTYDLVSVNARGQVVAGSRQISTTLTADTVLTAAHRGDVVISAAAANRFITLPSSVAVGTIDIVVRRADNSGNLLVVNTQAGDRIRFHTHLNNAGYPHLLLMGFGDWWHLRSDGAGSWFPVARMDSTPLGSVVMATTTAIQPGGYGLPNGSILGRGNFPWLWDHIVASGMVTTEALWPGNEGYYSTGDAVNTFRVPDVRAHFLRALDEGRGIDPWRNAGSVQNYNTNIPSGQLAGSLTSTLSLANGTYVNGSIVAVAGAFIGSTVETRPRNIAYPARLKLI